MEFLNRIELRGVVGRADINSYNGNQVCNFSVVTEKSAVSRDGSPSVETNWFQVTAWDRVQGIDDLSQLQKGLWVEVIGSLRQRKWVNAENEERTAYDVQARLVKVLPREALQMSPQRDY